MNRPLSLLVALVSLFALVRPAGCQTMDFKTLLSGSMPLTLTLKDMDDTWRSVTIATPAGAPDPTQAYLAMLSGGAGVSAYYTKGETATAGGETFLVTYHRQLKIDVQSLLKAGGDLPKIPELTPDTPLSLSLLNVHALSSLSDIQPFSLAQALSSANAPQAGANDPEQTSISNLKQLGVAFMQYTQDNDENLPPLKSTADARTALYPYVKSYAVFQQPQTGEPYLPNTSLSHRTLASFNDPSSMVTYYEAGPAPDGKRAVLFLDGHVKRLDPSDWQRVKTASHVPNPH